MEIRFISKGTISPFLFSTLFINSVFLSAVVVADLCTFAPALRVEELFFVTFDIFSVKIKLFLIKKLKITKIYVKSCNLLHYCTLISDKKKGITSLLRPIK